MREECACRYEDWMKMFLRSCGPKCAKVRMLPVFDLTQVSLCRAETTSYAWNSHAWA